MKSFALLLLALLSTSAFADEQLSRDVKTTGDIAQVLRGVTIYGTTFLPDQHCNVSTIENPDQLEVFRVRGKEMTVVLCGGNVEGAENVVTIFSKSEAPVVTRLKPPANSARVTDQQIQEVVSKARSKTAPPAVETADVHKVTAAEYTDCLKANKKNPPGAYVGETFSKASSTRGMFEAMTLYACLNGSEVLFNPENRIQMLHTGAKISYLNAACEKKRTIDIPDVVPKTKASHVMVVKCGLLRSLVNPPAH